MPVATDTLSLPRVRLRGRSFMALVVAPEFPMSDWFGGLDEQLAGAAGFFAERPVVADLSAALAAGGPEALPIVLEGLEARGLRLIGVDGIAPVALAGTRWARLPRIAGRDVEAPKPAPTIEAAAEAAPAPTSLLIDRPVRSGESIVFEDGDVTVVGAVGSGAEVIAGGSVHVYGALRGRAIAGLRAGPSARIFCRRMEAELVAVDRLYRTAEHWGEGLHGRAVQVLSDRGALRLAALD